MKISITLFVFISLSLSLIGQKKSISINYKPSISFFGKQKQSFTNYYFKARNGNATFRQVVNIIYSYQKSSKIAFATGLEYSQQGQNISLETEKLWPNSSDVILKTKLDYIRIPLVLDYTLLQNIKSRLTIFSGASLGIAIKRDDNYNDIILESILLPPAKKVIEFTI